MPQDLVCDAYAHADSLQGRRTQKASFQALPGFGARPLPMIYDVQHVVWCGVNRISIYRLTVIRFPDSRGLRFRSVFRTSESV